MVMYGRRVESTLTKAVHWRRRAATTGRANWQHVELEAQRTDAATMSSIRTVNEARGQVFYLTHVVDAQRLSDDELAAAIVRVATDLSDARTFVEPFGLARMNDALGIGEEARDGCRARTRRLVGMLERCLFALETVAAQRSARGGG